MGPFWVSQDQKRPGWAPLTEPYLKILFFMFITPGIATFHKVSSNSVPNIHPPNHMFLRAKLSFVQKFSLVLIYR